MSLSLPSLKIKVNKWLGLEMILKISEELNIPYIITTDSHYARPEDRPIHKAYLNSQNGDREVDEFYATTYLMSDEEIKNYFNYLSLDTLDESFGYIEEIKNKCVK